MTKLLLLNPSPSASGLTVHSNADISALEGWGVVDAVSGHAHHVATLLQDLHNGVLVLREHLGKAVSMLHQLINILDSLQVDDALLGLQAGDDKSLCAPISYSVGGDLGVI